MRNVILPLFLVLAACATTTPSPDTTTAVPGAGRPGLAILNASLWVQSAAEYRAVTMQTWAAARRALDESLADRTRVGALEETNTDPAQPPAIILDLDETVLDNTPFEARMIQSGRIYDDAAWKRWVAEAAAPATPGATEFLAYAKSRGVTVFYISNRDEEDEGEGTRKNVRALGFPLDPDVDTILLRHDKVSDKSPRRKQVADRYRVLLVFGDDLNDFANMRRATLQERSEFLERTRDWWGTRWFMIPNPIYGSWEHAAIGGGGTDEEKNERKVRVMRP